MDNSFFICNIEWCLYLESVYVVKFQALDLLMDFSKYNISFDTPRIDYFDLVLDELSHFSNLIRRTKLKYIELQQEYNIFLSETNSSIVEINSWIEISYWLCVFSYSRTFQCNLLSQSCFYLHIWYLLRDVEYQVWWCQLCFCFIDILLSLQNMIGRYCRGEKQQYNDT